MHFSSANSITIGYLIYIFECQNETSKEFWGLNINCQTDISLFKEFPQAQKDVCYSNFFFSFTQKHFRIQLYYFGLLYIGKY
jgi:hypothetical protein